VSDANLIYGIHSVTAAAKADPEKLETVWVLRQRDDQRLRALLDILKAAGVRWQWVQRQELEQLLPGEANHQGVVAQFRGAVQRTEQDLDALLDGLTEPPFLLILDGVTDPHNLGACLRTADAAGVHAVIAPRDKAAGITPTVRKVASGAAESIPFIQVTNLARSLRELKDRGVWLVGLAGEASDTLYSNAMPASLGVVMGAEGDGMRRLTREHCDFLVSIPMLGAVESLNVSVATGVVLFEARRQRMAGVR
jgi:23S rRNA (guanosine2251-2'-O)-methyltransferase